MTKDTSPIDQKWIMEYVDKFIEISGKFSDESPMREAIAIRIEYVMDLVEAWQKRNWPIDRR